MQLDYYEYTDSITAEQINKISSKLNELEKGGTSLFEEEDKYVQQQVDLMWNQLIEKGKVDITESATYYWCLLSSLIPSLHFSNYMSP